MSELRKMTNAECRRVAYEIVLQGGQRSNREDRKAMIENMVCDDYAISGWDDDELAEYMTPQDYSYMDFLVRTAKVELEKEEDE